MSGSSLGEETKTWPGHPVIYEVNTWGWLNDLGRKHQRHLDLTTIPDQEWDAIADQGFDAVWFKGVWERGLTGIGIWMRNDGLFQDLRRALPDFAPEDNAASPYCVRRYVVDEHLGGPKGLAAARRHLGRRGMRLILDFVPNHVARDHPWVSDYPEYFIHGNADDARCDPGSFIECGRKVYACGRGPYSPVWPDVLQLNAFHPGQRQAVIETISEIAEQCDGIRCDMAMLVLNAIFERTWGGRAGSTPDNDYWTTVIPAVKGRYPEFRFIAEAYWDLEWELQQQGFRLLPRQDTLRPDGARARQERAASQPIAISSGTATGASGGTLGGSARVAVVARRPSLLHFTASPPPIARAF